MFAVKCLQSKHKYILYFNIPQRNRQLTHAIHHHVGQARYAALEEQVHPVNVNPVFTVTLELGVDQNVSLILIVQLHDHVYGPIVAILVQALAV